jgi:hypothetical protein
MYPKYLSNTSEKHLALTTRYADDHLLYELPCDQVRILTAHHITRNAPYMVITI